MPKNDIKICAWSNSYDTISNVGILAFKHSV